MAERSSLDPGLRPRGNPQHAGNPSVAQADAPDHVGAIPPMAREPAHLYWATGILALLILGGMAFTFFTGQRLAAMHGPLTHAAARIQFEATAAHLQFEEVLLGARATSLNDVWEHLETAQALAQQMLDGGENAAGTVVPLKAPELRKQISAVLVQLHAFSNIAHARVEGPERGQVAGPATDAFDAIFDTFMAKAHDVEVALQEMTRHQRRAFDRTAWALMAICTLLCGLVGHMFYRVNRAQTRALHALQQAESRLRDRAGALERSNRRLADSHRERNEYAHTLQAIMDHAPFGIWLTDDEGRVRFVNETLCNELGVPEDAFVDGGLIGDRFDQQVQDEFSATLGRTAEANRNRTLYTTYNVPGQGLRDLKVTRVTIHPDDDVVSGFIGIVEDVTETRRLQQELTHQASHDALTGLMNRVAFERKLDQVCRTIGPRDVGHALCYMDLDQFKIVNDTCGHPAGDELLRQLTQLYRAQLRRTEHPSTDDDKTLEPALARLGGDEFGLILYNCTIPAAKMVAERLVADTHEFTFHWEDQAFRIGCSIGIVPITHDNDGMAEVLKKADSACYVAKDKGRGRVHALATDDSEVQDRSGTMQWVPRITEALETDRFRLVYQAIAPLHEPEAGDRFEVLVRYQADDDALIPPGGFLPAAERYGLMHRVDRWVIDRTFQELTRQYGPGSPHVLTSASINISGQSLGEEWLLEHICEQFEVGLIRPQQICLEITETAAISNLDNAMRIIAQLRDLGVHFSLDDFGSGLSSFSYLKHMNVDYLKIDGSLVRDIARDPVDRAMVASIVEVARVMGLKTVAEWVESPDTIDELRRIGVDYAQGFGIMRPTPLAEYHDGPGCRLQYPTAQAPPKPTV